MTDECVAYRDTSVEEAAQKTLERIRHLSDGTYCLVTSGEANPRFWNIVAPEVSRVRDKRGIKFVCLLGPIACVDDDSEVNPLVALGKSGVADVFSVWSRCSWHGRLLGVTRRGDYYQANDTSVLLDELPHNALAGVRLSHEFHNANVIGRQLIDQFLIYVQVTARLGRLKLASKGASVINLKRAQLDEFKGRLQDLKIAYNRMTRPQAALYLQQFGIISPSEAAEFMRQPRELVAAMSLSPSEADASPSYLRPSNVAGEADVLVPGLIASRQTFLVSRLSEYLALDDRTAVRELFDMTRDRELDAKNPSRGQVLWQTVMRHLYRTDQLARAERVLQALAYLDVSVVIGSLVSLMKLVFVICVSIFSPGNIEGSSRAWQSADRFFDSRRVTNLKAGLLKPQVSRT